MIKCVYLQFLSLIFVLTTAPAQDVDKYQMIDCGTDKVVLIESTTSPDGRYAVGWTIRPKQKKTVAVDWAAWDKIGIFTLLERYPSGDEKAPYDLLDCVVDLKMKQVVVLPTEWSYYPHKNRGYLKAIWSLESEIPRYALIQNDSRFYTNNLWLVRMDGDGMKQMDLGPKLNKSVKLILEKNRPTNYEQFGVYFPLIGADYGMEHDTFFKGHSLSVVFLADVPKSIDEKIAICGILKLQLPDGKVSEIKLIPPKAPTFHLEE